MAEWDADDYQVGEFKAPPVSDKWEGEDEEDDVKDNWDDEDEEQQQPQPETETKSEVNNEVKAIQVKKKNVTKIKLREKQEEKRKELEEQEQELDPQQQFEEKLRRQKLEEDADLELAKEAFGTNNDSRTGVDSIDPSNKDDFDLLRKALVEKLGRYEKESLYFTFLDELFRDLCLNMEPDDVKKLGSTLSTLASEKVKAAKAKQKKKGSSKKASLVVGKASEFDYDYGTGDYGGDEFDDFM